MGRAGEIHRLIAAATAAATAALTMITPSSPAAADTGRQPPHLHGVAAPATTSGLQSSDRRPHFRWTWIAFASDRDSLDQQEANDDIYLVNPRSGRTVRIVVDPPGSSFLTTEQFPIISADGRTLLFESNRSTADFPNPDGSLDLFAFYTCRLHLEARTPSCTHLRRVARTVPPAWYQNYALTPDGRSILYSNGDLYRAPLDGSSAPVKLASAASQPDVSPDGRHVAYSSSGDLWTAGIDGGEPIQLTDRLSEAVPPVYQGPDWSPDGRRLAFHSTRGGLIDFDIWVMKAAPLGPDNIPVDITATVSGPDELVSHERHPTWSPDGRRIAFVWHVEHPTAGFTAGFNESEIFVVDAEDTDVRNLTANYDETRDWDDPAQIGDISPDWGATKRR